MKATTLSDARRVSGPAGAGPAAMSGSAMAPRLPGPLLLGELPPPQQRAVVRFHFEQRHGPSPAAGDDLPARRLRGTDHGPEYRAGSETRGGRRAGGEEGGLPHRPAAAVEPTEPSRVGLGEGADENVEGASVLAPAHEAACRP